MILRILRALFRHTLRVESFDSRAADTHKRWYRTNSRYK